jgi:hypothetical protein
MVRFSLDKIAAEKASHWQPVVVRRTRDDTCVKVVL